jgi:uncharacterized protein (DUF697 family)
MPNEYDCFLLCSAGRFHQTDYELVSKIHQQGKNVYFVHTKFDEDIEGRQSVENRYLNEEEIILLMEEIKESIRIELTGIKLRRPIFVVSALMVKYKSIDNRYKYDFPCLMAAITNNFVEEKKNAFILTITPICKSDIEDKFKVLRNRIKFVAGLSGIFGLIPIPGVSIGIDLVLLVEEVIFYIYQLKLTKPHFQELAESFGVECEELIRIADKYPITKSTIDVDGVVSISLLKESFKFFLDLLKEPVAKMLTTYLQSYLTANTVEEITKVFLPGIGSIIGAMVSSGSTYYVLKNILDNYEKALLEIFEYCMKK